MSLSFDLVKTAADERGDRLLAREAQWLRELGDVPELEDQVPRLIEEGMRPGGRRYLVISMRPGRGEMRAFTPDHARFLASLGKARFRALDFEVTGTCRWLLRSLAAAGAFAAPRELETLEGAFHDCESALLYWTGPYVLAQGDFAPWNIRGFSGQLFVTEWGHAHADASPLDDVLHYLMVQRALSRRPVTAVVLRRAMRRATEFAQHAYPDWSWRPPVIGALTLVHLLGTVLHQSLARQRVERADPLVGAYWKLLEKRSAWMPK